MELTIEERQAVERGDYSACDPDDLAALTAEVLPDEDWTMPEGHPTVHIFNPQVLDSSKAAFSELKVAEENA